MTATISSAIRTVFVFFCLLGTQFFKSGLFRFFAPQTSAKNAPEIKASKFEGALCAVALSGPVFDSENGTLFKSTLVLPFGGIACSVRGVRQRLFTRHLCEVLRISMASALFFYPGVQASAQVHLQAVQQCVD